MPADDTTQPDPTLWDAISDTGSSIGGAAEGAAAGVQEAGQDAAETLVGTAISGVASTSHAVASGGAAMAVTFSDIEAMTASIQSLNQVVVPTIGSAAALAVDGDLLESLVLSPITGANAEAAALLAATQLTAKLVVFEGLALVTATVVSTYQLADNALQVSAAAIGGGVSMGGAFFGAGISVGGAAVSGAVDVVGATIDGAGDVIAAGSNLLGAVERLPLIVLGLVGAGAGSYLVGVEQEIEDTFWGAVGDAADRFQEDPWGALSWGGMPLIVEAGQSIFDNFSINDIAANGANNLGNVLGATGPFYDDILEAIIHDGQALGLFNDGEAVLGDPTISNTELDKRAGDSAVESWEQINDEGIGYNLDDNNRIKPTDVSSLLAGAKQIDATGAGDFAEIRILESQTLVSIDDLGQPVYDIAYTVQIPSTLSWNPIAGTIPNDVTSDLIAMSGDQTALTNAVFAAMDEQGIPTGPGAPPVMMVGFSLGGITAASMAADPRGYNIQQVVTAGSPISEIAIPAHVDVTAFQAKQDVVPETSGGTNPSSWTTVQKDGPLLLGEDESTLIGPQNAHDANRYAVMAANEENVNTDAVIAEYFSGDVTVNDYYATRE
jgi:hypothetical protein